ncbi:MAG: hypothetical protein DMG65_04065 [Candidatus Angelobacter sp. Gp1-AA117]|nr:MAG: hypothetical protein DMG65_04065 [Candidatus Angelobacter sp. Gp1-AA117]
MRHILICGIESLLGSHLAGHCLRTTDDRIFYRFGISEKLPEKQICELVCQAACQSGEIKALRPEELTNRLLWLDQDLDIHQDGQISKTIDEVWYCADGMSGGDSIEIEGLISACAARGAKEFNYVRFEEENCGTVQAKEEVSDYLISQWCMSHDVGYRIFRTPLLPGNVQSRQAASRFSRFLLVLHSFKQEIEERCPQYFDFHALRCLVQEGAAVNLITAAQASESLLRVAHTNGTINSSFSAVNPQDTPVWSLCERIGVAYGLGLLPVRDFGALNAIDRVFHERTEGGFGFLPGTAPPPGYFQADSAQLDEDTQIAIFESIRRSQDDAAKARKRRVANLPARLREKTISINGTELNYYVGGSGAQSVVLLNALGQKMECWHRLIDELAENYTVITWEPRGTASPPPPFGLADQVNDLDAILQQEVVEKCHLVGWCTGAKVAIDFYLRRPSVVTSMAFLNSTFKCDGSPEELDSPYERNMESLCRMLVRKPVMAASVMKNLQSPPEQDELEFLNGPATEDLSVSVLSLMNINLRSYVVAPFKTEATTANYAHQLVDFWSHDSRGKASEVQIPVLLMAAEYDQVAAPASSEIAAGRFPNARYIFVKGATHYCLYDRADFVADLLRKFFADPEELPVALRAQEAMAQA